MSKTTDRLGEYLAPDERLVTVSDVTLSGDSPREAVSLGLTDRRLLYVSEDGGFTNIEYDAICAVRSRPRTTRTYRGNDHRLLLGIGGLVAILGYVGAIALTTGLLVPILLLATAGSLVSAEYLRRKRAEDERITVTKRIPFDIGDTNRFRRYKRSVSAGEHQLLMIGSGLVALFGAVGVILLASSALVFLAAIVGGIALIDYAYRHRHDFDGIEIVRHRETEVSVSTSDGRTVRIRSDESEEIGRELSKLMVSSEENPTTSFRAARGDSL